MTAPACWRWSIAWAISGVGQRGDAHLDDLQAGQRHPGRDLGRQLRGDDVRAAAQRGLARARLLVRVGGGHVAQRGLGLGLDELLVGLDGEDGPGGVGHLPHDDGGDVDGVAVQVVDLELVGLEVVDLDGDPPAGGQWRDEHEARMAHGADVAAEKLAHAGLPGNHDGEAVEQGEGDEELDAPGDDAQHGSRPIGPCGDEAEDDEGRGGGGERQDEEQSEEGGTGARGQGRLLRDVDPAGGVSGGIGGLVQCVGGNGSGADSWVAGY